MKIRTAAVEEVPLSLLLLADPSAERISRYARECVALVAEGEVNIVGALLLTGVAAEEAEIMNMAVAPRHRRQGIGSALAEAAAARARELGARRLCVGTGNSSLDALGFYQRVGFRISGVTPDYFEDYEPPIVENGIRCLDMIHLVRVL
jgi:ribosomal protein S18 acetylase RimI-like enzyme